MANDDLELMALAMEVARAGMAAGEMPIGALVAVDGAVVAQAYTQERSQRRLLVHADLLALDSADRDLAGRRDAATLYVTLEPCIMCLGAAFTARIGRVVYGLQSPSDGGVAAFHFWDRSRDADGLPGYQAPVIRGGVLRKEIAELFGEYADVAPSDWTGRWARSLAALA